MLFGKERVSPWSSTDVGIYFVIFLEILLTEKALHNDEKPSLNF
jgi:hypothetical protein